MQVIQFIQYVILTICFIFIPAWFFIFVIGYILEVMKKLNNTFLLPMALMLTQLGLWHFYFQNRLYTLDILFMCLSLFNLAIITLILFNKNKNKVHFYLIPFFLEIFWVILYLYS